MLKSEPLDPFLNYALAMEYAAANDLKKAIEILEDVLLKDENYLAVYYQLGKYYEQIEELEKAISIYQRGIVVARLQKNNKTLGELNEALSNIE